MAAPGQQQLLLSSPSERDSSRSPRRVRSAVQEKLCAHVVVEVTKLDGNPIIQIAMPSVTTIGMIKDKVAANIGVESTELRLVLAGKVLGDDDILGSLGSSVRLSMIQVRRRLLLTGSSDSVLRLWDLSRDCHLVRELKGHQSWVLAVSVDWSSSLALTASDDFDLRLWDLNSGKTIRALHGHHASVLCLAVDWKSQRALSGSYDRSLRLWDLKSGKTMSEFTGHRARVQCVVADDGMNQALSGSGDCTLRLWNTSLQPHEVKTSIKFGGHRSTVMCVVVNWVAGRAVSRSKDSLRLWDLVGGTCLSFVDCVCEMTGGLSFFCCCADCIAVDWESRLVLSADCGCSHGFKSWDIVDGRSLCKRIEGDAEETGIRGPLQCLIVDWTLKHAVSGSPDGSIKMWDLGAGECTQSWNSRGGRVVCLAVESG